ncbi:MAG: helix-turn-helix domain-containing protein [Gemmatimonadaceae bacterium]
MTKRAGVGQFFAWNGGCLFIGHHDRILAVHSHQAIQLVVADEGDHRVRAGESEPWVTYSVAAIPTRHPHGLDVTDSNYGAVIFIEPETREGRAVTQRFLQGGIAEVGNEAVREITRAIFARWLQGRKDDVVSEVHRLVQTLSAGVEPAVVTDPRIVRAIEYINQHLSRPLTLDEVASHACLSPSRFRHLFSEQTSMGLRPYILWRRFILVWDLIQKGGTLSEAAHAAGFADSAHLSRTSTRNFGFAPSAMQLVLQPPDPQTLPRRTPRSATG